MSYRKRRLIMQTGNCSTKKIADVIRNYEGVKRKHTIGEMVRALRIETPDVIASFGEDAAVIRHNDEALLLAADGIWSRLMEADPYWAGYCSVLVNIHDIAAMGGKPLAMVDIFSISDEKIRSSVIKGMHDASLQFGVPIVGGHLHPDTPYSVIDIAILGFAQLDSIIFSHTANVGDKIITAIDLNGRVHPSCSLNWDSVTMKSAAQVQSQIQVMEKLGQAHLLTAGKDISNPGIIGTLGMLLEVSEKGAEINLDLIPRPDLKLHKIPFEMWVKMYPGMGFLVTAREENVEEACNLFSSVGIEAKVIGEITDTRELKIMYKEEESSVFDLSEDGIMSLFSGD